MDCIFCKIVNKETPTDIVFENDNIIVIKDINPKAKVHLLLIPKKHIESINNLEENDKDLMGGLMITASKVSKQEKIENYKLKINVGRKAGQIIDHLHIHLMAD